MPPLLQSVLTFRLAPAHRFCWMPSAAYVPLTIATGISAETVTEMVSRILRSIVLYSLGCFIKYKTDNNLSKGNDHKTNYSVENRILCATNAITLTARGYILKARKNNH